MIMCRQTTLKKFDEFQLNRKVTGENFEFMNDLLLEKNIVAHIHARYIGYGRNILLR